MPSHQFIHKVIHCHDGPLRASATTFCKDDNLGRHYTADDLMDDFYLKLLEKPEVFQAGYDEKGPGYLFTTLRNLQNEKYRELKAPSMPYDDVHPETFASPAATDSLMFALQKENFLELVDRYLDDDMRKIIRLRIDGFKYKEIAVMLGMNLNTVGVKVNRNRDLLARLWKQAFGTDPDLDQF